MTFDISRCDFALLSSATFLSPEIAHHSIMLVLLSACIHSLKTKTRPSNDSSEITDSVGTGRFSTKHVETTEFCSWECMGQETRGKYCWVSGKSFCTVLKGARDIQTLKGKIFTWEKVLTQLIFPGDVMGTRNKQKSNFYIAFHEPGFSVSSLRCFKTEVAMSRMLSSGDPYLDCGVILTFKIWS